MTAIITQTKLIKHAVCCNAKIKATKTEMDIKQVGKTQLLTDVSETVK
jgi:hypothetical protein